jgi:hypothetical protein
MMTLPMNDHLRHCLDPDHAFGLLAIVAEDAMRPGHGIRRDGGLFKRRGSPMAC